MKHIIITIFATLLILVNAQSVGRNSVALPVVSEPTAVLAEGTGWHLNEQTGQWVSYDRLIGDEILDKYPELVDVPDVRSRQANYDRIEARQVTVNGTNYYGIFMFRLTGKYKYPAIKKDWYAIPDLQMCLFDNENRQKVLTALGEIGKAQSVELYCDYGVWVNEEDALTSDLLQASLSIVSKWSRGDEPSYPIVKNHLRLFPVDYEGQRLVRFGLVPFLSDYELTFDPKIFDERYFEVGYDKFRALFE